MRRKIPLVTGEVYHIFSKSIAGFRIFNSEADFLRLLSGIRFFRARKPGRALSCLLRDDPERIVEEDRADAGSRRIQLIAYCIMQTHFHLLLRQNERNGISDFMSLLQNSYTRYFNLKYRRKGPLWESAFKNVTIESDEQALHVTRYIHLNPATAYLVDKAADWKFSSYLEYLGETGHEKSICEWAHFPILPPRQYEKFVNDRIHHQRMLDQYKHLALEDSSVP